MGELWDFEMLQAEARERDHLIFLTLLLIFWIETKYIYLSLLVFIFRFWLVSTIFHLKVKNVHLSRSKRINNVFFTIGNMQCQFMSFHKVSKTWVLSWSLTAHPFSTSESGTRSFVIYHFPSPPNIYQLVDIQIIHWNHLPTELISPSQFLAEINEIWSNCNHSREVEYIQIGNVGLP